MKCAYSSNIGIRRKTNQDACLAANFEKDGQPVYVFVVADGLGGHPAGETASEIAVNYIKYHISVIEDFSDYDAMNVFVNDINQAILDVSRREPEKSGMATTLTMGIVKENLLYIAHVGDSRAYRISGGDIEQLTKDHSLVQILVDEGRIDSSQARIHPKRNVITRALGTDEHVKADCYTYEIRPNDCFMLCSDGLYNMVSESVIQATVSQMGLEKAVKTLVNMANQNGGTDNITLILFHQDGIEADASSSSINSKER